MSLWGVYNCSLDVTHAEKGDYITFGNQNKYHFGTLLSHTRYCPTLMNVTDTQAIIVARSAHHPCDKTVTFYFAIHFLAGVLIQTRLFIGWPHIYRLLLAT